MSSKTRSAIFSLTPRPFAPAMNLARCSAMRAAIFLPMAFRRSSASLMENPAMSLAIFSTCSW